jgi:methylmalonyl-CoA mutase C-terminal domain/subunit
VLAKLGLDGHDVGVRLIGKRLMEAGFEVVYLGKRVPTANIVGAALQEDAAAIGLSCLSGGLGYFATRTVEGLRKEGADIPVLAGGIDEPDEIEKMMNAGVRVHFGPGTPIEDIVKAFEDALADQ